MGCIDPTPICVVPGEHFSMTIWAAQKRKVWKPITAATQAAPCQLTVTAHGMPSGWPLLVSDVKGMEQLDSKPDAIPYIGDVLDANTIALRDVSSLSFDTYQGGGTIAFPTPLDLSAYTGRVRVYDKEDGNILQTYTDSGHVVLDNTAKTVTVIFPSTSDPSLWGWYVVEIIDGNSEPYGLCRGPIHVD